MNYNLPININFEHFLVDLKKKTNAHSYEGRIAHLLNRVVNADFRDDEGLHLPEEITNFLLNSVSKKRLSKIARLYRKSIPVSGKILPFVLKLNSFERKMNKKAKYYL